MGAQSSAVYLEFIAHILKKPVAYFAEALVRESKIEGHPDRPFETLASSVLSKSGMQFC